MLILLEIQEKQLCDLTFCLIPCQGHDLGEVDPQII